MNGSSRKPWLLVATVAGVLYFVLGYGSAALDPSLPDRSAFTWRLAAWLSSGAVFAVHIWYERFRLAGSPLAIALHVAAAVALGAFLIASAALVHATTVIAHAPYSQFLLALVLWPLITALPAFLVALVASAVLAHLPRRT